MGEVRELGQGVEAGVIADREQALSVCSRAGASELGDFRASSLATQAQMVASGTRVTLLPELATQDAQRRLDRDRGLVPFSRPAPKGAVRSEAGARGAHSA